MENKLIGKDQMLINENQANNHTNNKLDFYDSFWNTRPQEHLSEIFVLPSEGTGAT